MVESIPPPKKNCCLFATVTGLALLLMPCFLVFFSRFVTSGSMVGTYKITWISLTGRSRIIGTETLVLKPDGTFEQRYISRRARCYDTLRRGTWSVTPSWYTSTVCLHGGLAPLNPWVLESDRPSGEVTLPVSRGLGGIEVEADEDLSYRKVK